MAKENDQQSYSELPDQDTIKNMSGSQFSALQQEINTKLQESSETGSTSGTSGNQS